MNEVVVNCQCIACFCCEVIIPRVLWWSATPLPGSRLQQKESLVQAVIASLSCIWVFDAPEIVFTTAIYKPCPLPPHLRIWHWTMFHNISKRFETFARYNDNGNNDNVKTMTMTTITMFYNDNDNNDNVSQWQCFTMTMFQTWEHFNNVSQCHTTIHPHTTQWFTMLLNISTMIHNVS